MIDPSASLVDAQERARQYPEAFHLPDIDDLQPGMLVKICRNRERFWVLVRKVTGGIIEGYVDNDLIWNSDLRYGTVVSFRACHIYDVSELITSAILRRLAIIHDR